jgi:tartrate dehydratase beta subunit/fumarate hydratase class I family protein
MPVASSPLREYFSTTDVIEAVSKFGLLPTVEDAVKKAEAYLSRTPSANAITTLCKRNTKKLDLVSYEQLGTNELLLIAVTKDGTVAELWNFSERMPNSGPIVSLSPSAH